MTRKRSAKFMVTLMAVAAIVWLAVWNSGKTHSAETTRIASQRDWMRGYGSTFPSEPYLWLTSHEILYYTLSTPLGGWDNANVLDTQTGKVHPAPGLIYVNGGHIVVASPDGQWVLWNTQAYNTSPPGMAATRRSDGKTIRWPHLQTWAGTGFWLPDSRRWVCVSFVPTGQMINRHPVAEKRLVVYDVTQPSIRTFAIPGDTGAENILGVTPKNKVIFNDSIEGWGGSPGQPQPPLSLREVSLDGSQPTALTFQVQVPKTPPGASPRLLLSPQGDRLLWTCFSSRPHSITSWIGYWTHRSYSGGTETMDIWVCPLNGSAPQHVETWSSPQMGFTACWNPDSKHISLTMQNQLYSVPVP